MIYLLIFIGLHDLCPDVDDHYSEDFGRRAEKAAFRHSGQSEGT